MSNDRVRMEQNLKQRLEQRLTPQLIMNMKLLELPIMELQQLVRRELEQNPALEQVEDGVDADAEERVNGDVEFKETQGDDSLNGEIPSEAEKIEKSITGDSEEYSFAELLPPDGWDMAGGFFSQNNSEELNQTEVMADQCVTMRETVLPQLQAILPPSEAALAEDVVEWLDDNGFLAVTVEELAEKLGVDEIRLRQVIYNLQRIPPGGLGCRNVREALFVQLEVKGYPPDALECRLLTEGWELMERRDTDGLAKRFGRGEDEIRAAIARLLAFETRPARQFVQSAVQYISPDFSVVWQGNRLVPMMNDEVLPRLRISRYFIEILQNPRAYSREQVEYAKKRVEAARALLKAIESRRRMLRRLMEMVLQAQYEFFVNGPEYLRPATLRNAADAIGVHPATVSRAISGKYIETPNGIFPLKFFFQSGTEDISRAAIKEKIKSMIESEDRRSPLKDDEIVARLKAEGIEISRRTVAKYRSEMGIPGSSERRGF